MKIISLILTAALSMTPAFNTAKLQNIEPANVIFCWDIHDTLLEKNTHMKFQSNLEKNLHLAHVPEALTIYKKLQAQYGFCAAQHTEDAFFALADEYLDKAALAEQQGDNRLAKKYRKTVKRLIKLVYLSHQFELSYTHKEGIKELLEALKAHGYTRHHVASNIAERHFGLIKNKFKDLFNDTMIKNGLIIDVHNAPHIKKPSPEYFKQLISLLNPHGDKVLVFVDDKEQNVESACNSGLVGIQIKDVNQLISELNKHGLDLNHNQSDKQAVQTA